MLLIVFYHISQIFRKIFCLQKIILYGTYIFGYVAKLVYGLNLQNYREDEDGCR